MIIQQFYDKGLAHASYAVIRTGKMIVIDPPGIRSLIMILQISTMPILQALLKRILMPIL
jgi:hypothetical protein